MRFERLDRRITLQQIGTTKHAESGEDIQAVVSETIVWAQKKALQGSEQFLADGEKSRGICLWYIRYMSGIDGQTYQLKDDNGATWDIIGEPREIGRKEGFELIAQRIAGQDGGF